jgi:hypothetical protein
MRKLGFNATGTVETPGTRANRGWGTSRAWAGACRRTLPRAPGLQSLAWCIAEVGQNPLNYNFLCDASRIDWTAKAVPLVAPCGHPLCSKRNRVLVWLGIVALDALESSDSCAQLH